ncbi:MAG: ankyrin repeat domain-containing protein [Cyclobacteriaceae bacterium]
MKPVKITVLTVLLLLFFSININGQTPEDSVYNSTSSLSVADNTRNLPNQDSVDQRLHKAVAFKDYQLARALIDSGFNVNTMIGSDDLTGVFMQPTGITPMTLAVILEDAEMMKLLFENGASIGVDAINPLFFVLHLKTHSDITTEFLMQNGYDLEEFFFNPLGISGDVLEYDEGDTLEFSQYFFAEAVLDILEFDISDIRGPFRHTMIEHKLLGTVEALLRSGKFDVNEPDITYGNGETFIQYLLEEPMEDDIARMSNLLIRWGATTDHVDLKDLFARNVLMDSLSFVNYLLDNHSVNVSEPDTPGNYPITYAAKNNNSKMIELLLANAANTNVRDSDGHTPLTILAQNLNQEMFAKVLGAGGNINMVDGAGNTPLMVATSTGDISMIRFLFTNNNLDINARNNRGESALMIAKSRGHDEIRQLLIDAGATIQYPDFDAKQELLQISERIASGLATPAEGLENIGTLISRINRVIGPADYRDENGSISTLKQIALAVREIASAHSLSIYGALSKVYRLNSNDIQNMSLQEFLSLLEVQRMTDLNESEDRFLIKSMLLEGDFQNGTEGAVQSYYKKRIAYLMTKFNAFQYQRIVSRFSEIATLDDHTFSGSIFSEIIPKMELSRTDGDEVHTVFYSYLLQFNKNLNRGYSPYNSSGKTVLKSVLEFGHWSLKKFDTRKPVIDLTALFSELDQVMRYFDHSPEDLRMYNREYFIEYALDTRTNELLYTMVKKMNQPVKMINSFNQHKAIPSHPYLKMYYFKALLQHDNIYQIEPSRLDSFTDTLNLGDYDGFEKAFFNDLQVDQKMRSRYCRDYTCKSLNNYVKYVYQLENRRFYTELIGRKTPTISEHEDLRNVLYEEMFSLLVDALNIRFNKRYTVESIQQLQRQPELARLGEFNVNNQPGNEYNFCSGTAGFCKETFLKAGIYYVDSDKRFIGESISFSPLAMIYAPGKEIEMVFREMNNVWIDVSGSPGFDEDTGWDLKYRYDFDIDIEETFPRETDTGSRPGNKVQVVWVTIGGVMQPHTLKIEYRIDPSTLNKAPQKRIRPEVFNGKNAGKIFVVQTAIDRIGITGIPIFNASGGRGETGRVGLPSPLCSVSDGYKPARKPKTGQVITEDCRFNTVDECRLQAAFNSPPDNKLSNHHVKRGVGGDGGESGNGGNIRLTVPDQYLPQSARYNIFYSAGIPGEGGSYDECGNPADIDTDFKRKSLTGNRGKAGIKGSIN